MVLNDLIFNLAEKRISIEVLDGELIIKAPKGAIDATIMAAIRNRKNEIIRILSEYRFKNANQLSEIKPAPYDSSYPVSSSQLRLWALSQIDEASVTYNISTAYVFEGELNVDALNRAFAAIIKRHEILRTIFKEDIQSGIRQYIVSPEKFVFNLSFHDIKSIYTQYKEIRKLILREFSKAFDLQNGPLIRASLFQIEDKKYIFTCVMHHIISDGWSGKILINELFLFYKGYTTKIEVDAPALYIQYKDFSVWQDQQLKEDNFKAQREYWLKQLADLPPILDFIGDKRRPDLKSYRGDVVTRNLGNYLSYEIKQLANLKDATSFMVLLTAINAIVYRYSGQSDIIIGTPVAGRNLVELKDQIGFYVNTLALRTKFNSSDSFGKLLENVREVTLNAYSNENYPFDTLLNDLRLPRNISHNPLFDIMAVMQIEDSTDSWSDKIANLKITRYPKLSTLTSKFDLLFTFVETEKDLELNIEYNSDIYHRSTIRRLAEHFLCIITLALKEPDKSIDELEYMGLKEKEKLLITLNKNPMHFISKGDIISITELFDKQVRKTPEALALIFENTLLTYKELNELSNQLARYFLGRANLKKGDIVCVVLDRSKWSVICMISIIKLGCVYFPIAPLNWETQAFSIAKEYKLKALITDRDEKIFSKAISNECHINLNSGLNKVLVQLDASNIDTQIQGSDLASIVYTSYLMSPVRIVTHTHLSLYNSIQLGGIAVGWRKTRKLLQFCSFDSNQSLYEVYCTLVNGGEIHVVSEKLKKNFYSLKNYIIENKISILSIPYTILKTLFNKIPLSEFRNHSISDILLRGNQLYVTGGLRKFLKSNPKVQIHSLYGYAETQVATSASYSFFQGKIPQKLTIGKPIDNVSVYILDKHMQMLPIGVCGEIYIAGPNLAMANVCKIGTPSKHFVSNPFKKDTVIYRTGDIGKWLPTGEIQCIGRVENMAEFAGYKIELEEIVNVLKSFATIIDAVVIAHKANNENGLILVAYIISDEKLAIERLLNYTKQFLPAHMIPSHFIRLDEFPLLPNGMIDKALLPELQTNMELTNNPNTLLNKELINKLSKIWKVILGHQNINLKSDFFELGGHSLKLTQLISHINNEFTIKLNIKELFIKSSFEEQVHILSKELKKIYGSSFPTKKLIVDEISNSSILKSSQNPDVSYGQNRLWFVNQIQKASIAYNVPIALDFKETPDIESLISAFNECIYKHEILRTTFFIEGEDLCSRVLPFHETNFQIETICIDNTQSDNKIDDLICQIAETAFQLDTWPLFRARIIKKGSGKFCLIIVLHHIICDGWSLPILVKEIFSWYNYFKDNRNLKGIVRKSPLKYSDYTLWFKNELKNNLEKYENYWLKQLNHGCIETLNLHPDYPRPPIKTYFGDTYVFEINKKLLEVFNELLLKNRCTLFMGLVSAIKILLYRYSGQEDVVVGSPVAGREHSDFENHIGFFVNMLPLYTKINCNENFVEILKEVKETILCALDNQLYPFDMLINKLNLKRELDHSPLFDITVILNNFRDEDLFKVKDAPINYRHVDYRTSKYDLTFCFIKKENGLSCYFEYNTDLFSFERIKNLAFHFETLLQNLVKFPNAKVDTINYLSDEERNKVLFEFNDTSVSYPSETTVDHLFEKQVMKTPDYIAMSFNDQKWTYTELNNRANQWANFLKNSICIKKGEIIAILMDRNAEFIPIIIGILKNGAVYTPIDNSYPRDRINYILSSNSIHYLITDNLSDTFAVDNLIRLSDVEQEVSSSEFVINLKGQHCAADPAYIMFTSGSTGIPKGVIIPHRAVVRLVKPATFIELSQQSVLLATGSFSFDATTFEFWGMLLNGGKLVLSTQYQLLDIYKSLPYLIAKEKINIMWFTASYLHQLIDTNIDIFEGLKTIITGGDKLSIKHINKLRERFPEIKIINGYGPTENTTFSLFHLIEAEYRGSIPIGRPIGNSTAYVLDKNLLPVGIGIIGEICVGGDGVAIGYLGNQELTSNKFIMDPFVKGNRLYLTGDLGRWLPDGTIEFLGRKDDQIKVRGFRVELGEIEWALLQVHGVANVAVAIKEFAENKRELVAYMINEKDIPRPNIKEIKQNIKKFLPQYMIPTYFEWMDSFPLNPNGKIQKSALPLPEYLIKSEEIIFPETQTEEELVDIWASVLQIDPKTIGIRDNFFNRGGDSLAASKIIYKAIKKFNTDLEILLMFKYPTIEEMATVIDLIIAENWENESGVLI